MPITTYPIEGKTRNIKEDTKIDCIIVISTNTDFKELEQELKYYKAYSKKDKIDAIIPLLLSNNDYIQDDV